MAALLRAPVGNNLDNNTQDVQNLKHNFALEGRYKSPVENGYIDRDLDDAIWSFQRDYNLKQDGRVNPGGETEATLIGALRGYDKLQKDNRNIHEAGGLAFKQFPRLFSMIAPIIGGASMMETWDKWREKSAGEREDALKNLDTQEQKKRLATKFIGGLQIVAT